MTDIVKEGAELSPLALTEQHIAALESAIRAEGYRIMFDISTGEFKLEKRCTACNDSGVASENYPESGGAGMPCPICCSPVPEDGTHSITEAFTPDRLRPKAPLRGSTVPLVIREP